MKREPSIFHPTTGMARRLSIAASAALLAVSVWTSFQPSTATAATGNELLLEQMSPEDVNKSTLACSKLENAVGAAVSVHPTQSPEIVSAALVRAPDFECQKRLVTVAIRALGDKRLVREYAPQIAEAAVRATPNCTTDKSTIPFDKDGIAFDKDGKGSIAFDRNSIAFDKDGKGSIAFDKDGKSGPPLGSCACAEAFTSTAIAALGGDTGVADAGANDSSAPRLYTTTGESYMEPDTVVAIVKNVLSAAPASCNESIIRSAIAAAPQYANLLSSLSEPGGFTGGPGNGPPSIPPPFIFPPPPTGGIITEVTPVN